MNDSIKLKEKSKVSLWWIIKDNWKNGDCFFGYLILDLIFCAIGISLICYCSSAAYRNDGYSYTSAKNQDGHLQFAMTTAQAYLRGITDYDVQVDLSGELFSSYEILQKELYSGDTVIQNEGVIRSEDGSVVIYLEYGPNKSNIGDLDFYQVVTPWSAKKYVENMLQNGNEEDYSSPRSVGWDTSDGLTSVLNDIFDDMGTKIVTSSGEFTDYAEDGNRVLQVNGCIDFGNKNSHVGVRVYNYVPLSEYKDRSDFVINEDIVKLLADGMTLVNPAE